MAENAIGERLRAAIEAYGISIAEFQRRMAARGVPGSSYAHMHRYLRGEQLVPIEFARAAADLLGRRVEWLLLDSGAPTEAEEFERQAREAVTGRRFFERFLWEPLGPLGRQPGRRARAATLELWAEIARDYDAADLNEIVERNGQSVTPRGAHIAQAIGAALSEPALALRDYWTTFPHQDEVDEYVVGVVSALRRWLRDSRRARGDFMTELQSPQPEPQERQHGEA